MNGKYFKILIFSILSTGVFAQTKTNPNSQPQELGEISWYRDFDQALEKSQISQKPILILFQEVPGCATCRNYGDNVLSHPLIKDAIENSFIPLAIFNNKGGADKRILEMYGEPSWNNPVARIIDHEGKNLAERLNGAYSPAEMSLYLVNGLKYASQPVPAYLELLSDALVSERLGQEEAYFQMYCFWTGEAQMGKLDGVVETSPGFMNGGEVVKVVFDKNEISHKELNNHAKQHQFTFVKDPGKFRMDKDPQYYLKKSVYKYLPLIKAQRSKINSALAAGKNPDNYLSPFQLELKNGINKNNSKKLKAVYDLEFSKAYALSTKR